MYYIGNKMGRKRCEEFDELIIGDQQINKNKVCKKIAKKEVKKFFISEVRPFSNSGAYIPCSEDYNHHKVYVIVLENKK